MPRTPPGTHPREPHATAGAASSASGRRGAGHGRRARRRASRRLALLAVLLILAGALVGGDLIRRGLGPGMAEGSTTLGASIATASQAYAAEDRASRSATPTATASPQPVLALSGDYPKTGPGTWVYAATQGPVFGTAGELRRFRVAVETGVPEDPAAFAGIVDEVLGDPRSWIAGRTLRLQRVPGNAPVQFTVYLATPGTTQRMCAKGGLDIRENGEPYTSCRIPGRVVINLARWRESVPDYVNAKVPLDVYRRYVINHETGHEFGLGHELCPGPGRPAPVMQQQTLGLSGCTANAWPYLDGRRYQGPPGGWE